MPINTSPFPGTPTQGPDLVRTYSTARHDLGARTTDQNGNQYMYVFADTEAIPAESLIQIDSTGVVFAFCVEADQSPPRPC